MKITTIHKAFGILAVLLFFTAGQLCAQQLHYKPDVKLMKKKEYFKPYKKIRGKVLVKNFRSATTAIVQSDQPYATGDGISDENNRRAGMAGLQLKDIVVIGMYGQGSFTGNSTQEISPVYYSTDNDRCYEGAMHVVDVILTGLRDNKYFNSGKKK